MTVINNDTGIFFITMAGDGTLYLMYDRRDTFLFAIELCCDTDYIDWLVNNDGGLIELYDKGTWFKDPISNTYYLDQLNFAINTILSNIKNHDRINTTLSSSQDT